MFITLTYDDEHLPLADRYDSDNTWYRRKWPSWKAYNREECDNVATCVRADITHFIREYKRIYRLTNDKFTYFGCTEYGDMFGRPHAHILMFGDDEFYDLFFEDSDKASERIKRVWHMGHVHVCLAGRDGMHYCTKYVLKDGINELPPYVERPCTIASKNLGSSYFTSKEGLLIRKKLEYFSRNYKSIMAKCPAFEFDDPDSICDAVSYLSNFLPKFVTILDDGKKVSLPRYFRKKLIGQFEHFKDNPMWVYTLLGTLTNALQYYKDWYEYDQLRGPDAEHWRDQVRQRTDKINQRLLKIKYDKNIKKKQFAK